MYSLQNLLYERFRQEQFLEDEAAFAVRVHQWVANASEKTSMIADADKQKQAAFEYALYMAFDQLSYMIPLYSSDTNIDMIGSIKGISPEALLKNANAKASAALQAFTALVQTAISKTSVSSQQSTTGPLEVRW